MSNSKAFVFADLQSFVMEATLPIAISPVNPRQYFSGTTTRKGPGFFEHVLDHFLPHSRNNYHPHVFGHRMTALFMALLFAVKIATLSVISFGPIEAAQSSAITTANIIALTNQSREGSGLKDLSENTQLDAAATAKAADMLAKGYFAHVTPDGRTPWDFITTAGYNYISAGENLAVNFTEAENVEDAWMNSPGHRANILNASFQEIGIGISQGQYQGHEAIFVVQMFGTPADQKIAINDMPTPVQTQAVPVPPTIPVASPAAAVPTKSKSSSPSPATPEQAPAAPTASTPVPLTLSEPVLHVEGDTVYVLATSSEAAIKVVATIGQQAVMLEPKANNTWVGSVPLSDVASAGQSLVVKAYDVSGKEASAQAAEFSGTTPSNFAVNGTVASARINLGGFKLDPKAFQQKFYLVFIAAMLASLVLAIGLRRHVQHLSLVANGSFVIILATLLWMAG